MLLSIQFSLVVTCWERVDFLALLCVMIYCVFVTSPCGVLGQVWCLIVLIPDLCLLSYFHIVYLLTVLSLYLNCGIFLHIKSFLTNQYILNALMSPKKHQSYNILTFATPNYSTNLLIMG